MVTKRCCCGCNVEDDDFNRPDSTALGSKWNEIGGDWRIESNTLRNYGEGILLTTAIQPAPSRTGKGYNLTVSFDIVNTATEWKIICGYTDASNYDYIRIYTDGTDGLLYPQILRRSGGVDTVLMDHTTHTDSSGWSFPTGVSTLNLKICYSDVEWSINPTGPQGETIYQVCGGGKDSLPAGGKGLTGFLKGDFDNWDYDIHWESQLDCPSCLCFCDEVGNDDDYKCLPETMTLTLKPTVTYAACTTAPPDHQVTLYQANPNTNGGPPNLPTFESKGSRKRHWYSNVLRNTTTTGEYIWFVLSCDDVNGIYLTILSYPSLILDPALTLALILQIPPEHRDANSGNSQFKKVESTCSPLNMIFRKLFVTRTAQGQCDLEAEEYDAYVTE